MCSCLSMPSAITTASRLWASWIAPLVSASPRLSLIPDFVHALLHPEEACDRIEREVPTALAGREAVRPLRLDGPVQLEVQVLRPQMTEHALLVPGMEREDGCTLRYAAPDFPTAYQLTELIATLGAI